MFENISMLASERSSSQLSGVTHRPTFEDVLIQNGLPVRIATDTKESPKLMPCFGNKKRTVTKYLQRKFIWIHFIVSYCCAVAHCETNRNFIKINE